MSKLPGNDLRAVRSNWNWEAPFAAGLTGLAAIIFVTVSPSVGSTALWAGAALVSAFLALTARLHRAVVLALSVFSTVFVFQSGIEVGYRAWFYAFAAIAAVSALLIRREIYGTAWRWALALCAIGFASLLFNRSHLAFEYGLQQAVNVASIVGVAIAANLGARKHGSQLFVLQLSRAVMLSITAALIVPLALGAAVTFQENRLGMGEGMDPNGVGVMAASGGIAALIAFRSATGPADRIVAIICLCLCAVGVLLTGSRQSLLILFSAAAIWTVRSTGGNTLSTVGLAAVLGLLLYVGANAGLFGTAVTRVANVISGSDSVDRIDHLRIAWAIALDHPLGAGPRGFIENYREYADIANVQTAYTSQRPHNLYAMILSDWGFLALAFALGWITGIAQEITANPITALRRVGLMSLIPFAIALLASTVAHPFLVALIAVCSPKFQSGR